MLAQFMKQGFYVRGFHQRVIMIWQDAPREDLVRLRAENGEQVPGELVHPLRALADMVMMFEAGRGDQKAEMAEVWAMGRRMPWVRTILPPSKQLFALFGRELTPEITRLGHGESLLKPQECGKVRSSAFTRFPGNPSCGFLGWEFRLSAVR